MEALKQKITGSTALSGQLWWTEGGHHSHSTDLCQLRGNVLRSTTNVNGNLNPTLVRRSQGLPSPLNATCPERSGISMFAGCLSGNASW